MTQPSRVLYLPPGVTPPVAVVAPQGPIPTGVPFDKTFFAGMLPQAVNAFCSQVPGCDSPVVELLTVDGQTHFVKGISGVADAWVALHTQSPDHDHAVQVFIPYQTIFRVAIHAAEDERRRHLGFMINEPPVVLPPAAVESPAAAAPAAKKPARPRTKK
jgi:hypothetical protein